MPKFIYTATVEGKNITSSVIAGTREEALNLITSKNQIPLSLEEDTKSKDFVNKKSFFDRFKKVSTVEILMLFTNLGTMMKAGLPIVEAIDTLAENQKDKRLQNALEKIRYDIENGETLSKSLRQFPDLFKNNIIAMIEIGEEGGNLDETILTLTEQLKKDYELKKKVKGAMTYPMVVMGAMLVIGTALITFVLPQITGFLDGMGELPITTKLLLWLSDFMQANIVYIVVGTVFGVFIHKRLMKNNRRYRYKVQSLLLKTPKFGNIMKQLQVAAFTRSLGTLMHSGVPIIKAMEIIENNTTNELYKEAYIDIKEKLARGVTLSKGMSNYPHLFNNLTIRMISVGEKTGETAQMLFNIADFYDVEIREFLNNISSIIEPILLFVLGGGVLILALGIITPMMSMMGNINSASGG